MDEKLQGKLRQAQSLIALAEHPNTPKAEAELAQAKADALIYQYKLESLIAGGVGKTEHPTITPTWMTWEVCAHYNEFRQSYRQIASMVVSHVDGMAAFHTSSRDGELFVTCELVGYEADVMFGELLFTSARLEFSRRLEPKVDPALSDRENAYNLRHAGLEGRRIAEMLWGENTKAGRSKARRYFEEEAKSRGEDPRPLMGQSNSVKVYRETYADAFVSELWSRLWRMRQERATEANALVLKGAKNAVEEAFYEKYPQFRPAAELPVSTMQKDCEKCKKAASGYCRDHQYLKPRKEKERRINYAAYERGRDAARAVDLGPGARRKIEGDDGPRGELT